MQKIVTILIAFLGVFLLTDCVQVPKDYVEHKVNLKNNLGELTIILPLEFDTVYSWTKYEDNPCAFFEMVRFANKKYSLLQESGFIYGVIPDSLYQLTIMQLTYHLDCDATPDFNDEILEDYVENIKAINPAKEYDFFIKEIRKINDKKFMIVGFNWQEEEGTCGTEILLSTEVKGYSVWLKFVCQAKNCTDFINKIERSFNSIKFK